MSGQGDGAIRLHEHGPLAAGQVQFLVNAVAPDIDARAAAGAPYGRISPGALRLAADDTVHLTDAPDPAEADAHAAPEILAGEPPTIRSEVFSLASTTYSLLTGHPPNPYGFATVRRARPDLLPQVDGVLARATARGAEFRFASAAEYAAALTAALNAVDQPVPALAVPAATPGTPGRAPGQKAAADRRSGRFEIPEAALPIVFLLLVVLLAAGFMALFLSGS